MRVTANLRDAYTSSADSASEFSVDELLATLAQDGHWPDIDVKHPPPSQAGVGRYVHHLRLWKLAAAWRRTSDPARRTTLAEALHRAFPLWLSKPAPNSIPWFRQIGTPQATARATLIFADELKPAEIQSALGIMKTCVRPDGVLDYTGTPATGQNLQHEAEIQIVAACLSGDANSMARYTAAIEKEINVRDVEGLQCDWSFHQHGPQLYSGALYGTGFARDGAKLARVLHRTQYAFRPGTIDALVHYVLDGQQWMTRGASFDHLTTGRLIAWPSFMGVEPESDQGVAEACEQLGEIAPERREELRSFAARLRGQASPGSGPAGNRVFWSSDYVAHQRPGFFASVRMTSRRVFGAESGSNQNELGYHLADGGMSVMISGDEYRGSFPLWDWRRVPGVTAVQNPTIPFPRHQWGRGSQGWSDFAGGVSDGTLGAAAMEQNRAGLYAKKAWFFLEDAILCMGADIFPHDPAYPVVTSVDQRWSRGPMRSSGGESHVFRGSGWVHHDGVAYLFSDAASVRAQVEEKTAPWSVINQAPHGTMFRKTPLSALTAAGRMFHLSIDHGLIGKAVSYCYLIVPGLPPENIDAWKGAGPQVLANDSHAQAIARDGLVQAVFWGPGELPLPDGRSLRISRSGLVQLRRDPAGKRWTLAAGNPSHREGPLRISIKNPGSAAAVEHVFEFPAGGYAGRPQVRSL